MAALIPTLPVRERVCPLSARRDRTDAVAGAGRRGLEIDTVRTGRLLAVLLVTCWCAGTAEPTLVALIGSGTLLLFTVEPAGPTGRRVMESV